MSDRRPLISESSDLSEASTKDGTTPVLPSLGFSPSFSASVSPPPGSPPRTNPSKFSRPGYERVRSDATSVPETLVEEDIADSFGRQSSGLGIAAAGAQDRGSGSGIASPTKNHSPSASRRVSIQSIPRVPVGLRSPSIRSPSIGTSGPNTGDPLLSSFPKDTSAESTPDLRRERSRGFSPVANTSYEDYRSHVRGKRSQGSLPLTPRIGETTGDYQRFLSNADTQRLRGTSIRSAYENQFRPTHECPTAKDFYQSRFSWLSVTIIILCLFSTVFSGIFLGVAAKGPRYGRHITLHGPLTPSDANVLTSVIAKMIELSFVTSFVAFLGQVLSRRAFMKEQGRGITLAEMSMWRWVVQPGTLITHWETAKYAGITVLGILSLLSAILATLYAPATNALVIPELKFGDWENKLMMGYVKTSFANSEYLKKTCQTPVKSDPLEGGPTCLQIEHAAQGYHNYQRYMSNWALAAQESNGTTDQSKRPVGFGLLHENTTITAKWINNIDTKAVSKKYGRAINNVSLAFPHASVFSAARDPRNDIVQPEELDASGIYTLRASVPSPVLNVLCVNMEEEELKPIIFQSWNSNQGPVDVNSWTEHNLLDLATTDNNTVVDEIFGWTKKDKQKKLDYPPVFAKYPVPFNTIMNHTSNRQFWGRDSIYLLGHGGKPIQQELVDMTSQYVLCQLRVSITTQCSTQYDATGSGGAMEAVCDKDNDDMAYIKSVTNATDITKVPDWRDIGFDWANSMSLNAGIMDGQASNSRLLTQLILQKNEEGDFDLNPTLPSPAEALAVMSGCTLLQSAQDAPFRETFDYHVSAGLSNILTTPKTEYFNARIRAQQYASGGIYKGSKAFMIVLLLVFLMNIFVLLYFILHRGLVTDFSEPPNLFTLAVNSPPSQLLAGSCGGGPEGKQYVVNWFVNTEGDHLYMEPGAKPIHHHHAQPHTHSAPSQGGGWWGKVVNSVTGTIDQLRTKGLGFRPGGTSRERQYLRPVSAADDRDGADFELETQSSRTSRTYNMLSKRRSML